MDGRLDLAAEIGDSAAGRLLPIESSGDADWRFWEKRSLNLHRVVGLWTHGSSSAREVGVEARGAIGKGFRGAWWRGLGFGIVVEVRNVESYPEAFLPLVDGRENRAGTWQWVILVSATGRKAAGLHTWIEGYPSPVYRGLLERLDERGFAIESARKDKDGLMKLLTAAKPRLFPDFRNDVRRA